MSSDPGSSGVDLLNRILEARWQFECAGDDEKADTMAALNHILDEALVARPQISRLDLMAAIQEPWRDYCRKKRKFG